MKTEGRCRRNASRLKLFGLRDPGRQFAGARVRLMRLGAVAVAGSVAGGIPETDTIRSIPEVMHRPLVKRHVTDITEISPTHVERYAFPGVYPPEFRRDEAFESRYLYALASVVMGPESGLCWLPEGPVLVESIGSVQRMLGWGNCLHEILRKPVPAMTSAPLVAFPPTGYFHWLLETVPAALRACETSSEATLLVHLSSPSGGPPLARWIRWKRTGRHV